ncbi:MAG: hypothetical protein BECKG1743D_GA0114223_100187 [Candidatus Kentron sp. G]|nr:MAG: hypothetical protein BECKG1743D_GA0114223_100187 [Candidatus Kentron sp. G]VFN01324.1 MAG: hypothetical protein BECKG1743E_GA0114224_103991 [Candidatus Kentron sp. G]
MNSGVDRVRHPTGNNLPTLLAYLLQILVQLLRCNDSCIVHYAPVIAPQRQGEGMMF